MNYSLSYIAFLADDGAVVHHFHIVQVVHAFDRTEGGGQRCESGKDAFCKERQVCKKSTKLYSIY